MLCLSDWRASGEYEPVQGPVASDLQIPPFTSFREPVFSQETSLRLPVPCQQSYTAFQPQEFKGEGKENMRLRPDLPTIYF